MDTPEPYRGRNKYLEETVKGIVITEQTGRAEAERTRPPLAKRRRLVTLTVGKPDAKVITSSTTLCHPALPVLSAMFQEGREDMLDYLADGSVFIDAKPWVFCGLVDRLRRQPHALQRPPKGVDTADWATELAYWGYEGGVATTKKRKASDEASDGDEEEEEEEAEGEAEDDSDDEEETVKGTMHDQWARKIVNALRKLLDDAGLLENAAITGDDITLESFPGTTWDVDGKKVDLFQWLYNSSGRYKDLIRRTLGCANLWAHQKMLERSKRANLMEPVGWPANTLMSHRNINQDATYSVSIKFSL